MAWSDGDLRALLAGLAIGGEWNGQPPSGGGLVPLIWYDAGELDHFYIGFKQRISDFSLGQFLASVFVIGNNQFITIVNAEKVNPTTIRVQADIHGMSRGVLVVGTNRGWLTFADGEKVPVFAGGLVVESDEKNVELAYLYDHMRWPALFQNIAEQVRQVFTAVQAPEPMREETVLRLMQETEEQVAVSYYRVEV